MLLILVPKGQYSHLYLHQMYSPGFVAQGYMEWCFCYYGYVDQQKHRIYTTSLASVYPLYVAKAEKKGRTKDEVDTIIKWLTGHSQQSLVAQIEKQTSLETFFAEAPKLNPARYLITGVVCGVRVEEIKEPTMQEIRYLDKLVNELAHGKSMGKILRV